MELYKELFAKLYAGEVQKQAEAAWQKMDWESLLKDTCYQALCKIKAALDDDTLSDFACIEQIVSVFEEMGSDGGSRHDFS